MRTAAWETAPQIALRNCSREEGECQYRCDFGEGGVHAIKHILFANGVPLLLFSPDMLVQTFPSVIRIIDFTFFFKK